MRKRIKKTICPNCGNKLSGADNYCPGCGQENHTHKLPLKELLLEFLESFFHLDTKVLQTLKDFLLKPGSVTKNFNENKRARYVPPFRFYLFISAIYFLALALYHPPRVNRTTTDNNIGTGIILKTDTALFSESEQEELKQLALQGRVTREDLRLFLEKHGKPTDWKNLMITRVLVTLHQSGEMLGNKILKNISYLMFLLMPLFALILYLVYYKKHLFYSEQLVFSVHFHTVAFILLLLSLLLDMLFPRFDPSSWALVACVVYLFLSVKHVFGEPWRKTLWKTILLLVGYFIIFVPILLAAVAGSLLL